MKRLIFLSAALLGAACSPQAAPSAPVAAEAGVHPVSGLEVVPLTITSLERRYEFRVEVARSSAEWSKGLMFRTAMAPDEGMLFVADQPQMRSFWMRNTVIPLDIVFVGPDRRIVNIAANARPYSETPIPSAAPAIAVLELNGGRAAELGIVAGAKVEW